MIARIFAPLLALAAFAAAISAAASPAPGDPYQIFAHARNVWAQQQYPQYLTYTVVVNVVERGVPKTKHYHLAYDLHSDKIDVNAVSDEELAAPPTPSGFIFHLQPRRQFKVLFDKKVGNPGEAVDYLGVPMISPTYSFGMSGAVSGDDSDPDRLVAQIRKEFNDPVPSAKAQQLSNSGPVKSIATVTAYAHNYDVRLAGIESIGGSPCYHLLLQPTHDPQRLRLREVWVDTQTFVTRQLVTAGNFSDPHVPWRITFAQENGALYIASETALAPVGVGMHRYEQASVSFDSIASSAPPSHPTGWFMTNQNLMAEPGTGGPR